MIKVILDSDVVIHFIKGGCLNVLPKILPTYAFVILDIVFERELAERHRPIVQMKNGNLWVRKEENSLLYRRDLEWAKVQLWHTVSIEKKCWLAVI